MDMKQTKQLLSQLSESTKASVALAVEAVEDGEHHMTPVLAALRQAEASIDRRLYQISDVEAEVAATEKAEQKRKADAAEAKRKAEERAKFEAKAIADAEKAAEAERLRKAEYDAHMSGESRKRYMKMDVESLTALAAKRNVPVPKGTNKAQLVNLILQADGLAITSQDQEAAATAGQGGEAGAPSAPEGQENKEG